MDTADCTVKCKKLLTKLIKLIFSPGAPLVTYMMALTLVGVGLTVRCMKIHSPGGKTRLSR